jgi:spermidine synthase
MFDLARRYLPRSTRDRMTPTIVLVVVACFFLSGATGLIYEVLWIRMLGLVFGHTVFAVTTVLTAFMAGLGLGSWIFGRVADRRARPLRLYGMLELGVGLLCLAVPLVLPMVEAVYRWLARTLALGFVGFSLAQFALVLGLLVPPTTLMGATLPILSRVFVSDTDTLGRRVGLLYSLNTLGAVVGTGLAGYLLLPALGMRATLTLAAVVNLAIGSVIVLVERHLAVAGAPATGPIQPSLPATEDGARVPPAALVAVGLALAGAASMIYEVAWTRALSLTLGSSTYAFTAMLLAFLLGLSLGSAAFSRFWGGRRLGPAAFGLLQLGAGATALVILPLFERLPDVVVGALSVSLAPAFVLVVEIVLAVAAMLAPTLVIGAGFPCAVQVAARGTRQVALDVGRLYAANTLGAIVGTVVAGFALMPLIGAHGAVKVAIGLELALGVVLVAAAGRPLSRGAAALAGALALVIVVGLVRVPAWNASVMAAGAAVYPRQYQRFAGQGGVARAMADSALLFYRDGLTATVSVHREGPLTSLRVNGKTDASTGLDMHMQLMLGHLPLLVRPEARSVLVIGLGSGVTAGAVAAHDVERIDVVEIEPAVVEAARLFARDNHDVLGDPRVRIVVGDARNVLLADGRRWDVIVSEPSNPWIGGMATLFTEEFYALARSRLAPGGVMVQWVDGYTLGPEDFKMVVKTFRTAFPATTIWNAQGIADFILLGAVEPRLLDLGQVQARWEASPRMRQDLEGLGFQAPWAFLADFILAEPDAARLTLGADLNTDDALPLEFSAPRSLHADSAATNYRLVRAFRTSEAPRLAGRGAAHLDTAGVRYDLGVAFLRKDLAADAAAQFERALAREPTHVPSLIGLGRALLREDLPLRAVESLEAARRREPRNAEAHAWLARAWQQQQQPGRALEAAAIAVRLAPDETAYRVHYAALLEQQGRAADAVEQYLTVRARRPADTAVLDGLASAYARLGRGADAVTTLEEAVALRPDDPLLLHRLGRAYLAVNSPRPAAQALSRAVARAPLLAQAQADLGVALLGTGDPFAASAALERALAVDPAHAGAAGLLGEINARLYGGKSP